MKNIALLYSGTMTLLIFSISSCCCAQELVSKTPVYTFRENEKLVSGENCFTLTAQKEDIFFVTRLGKEYFTFENGARKGPFDKLSDDMVRFCDRPEHCAKYEMPAVEGEELFEKYIKSDGGMAYISFNGKDYGPYLTVVQIIVAPDKSAFYALVMDQSMKQLMVSSAGSSFEVQGIPQSMIVSPDGRSCILPVTGTANVAMGQMPTMDDLNRAFLYFQDARKLGPYPNQDIGSGNPWFCRSAGSSWFMRKGNDVLINGNLFKTFEETINPCDLWVSADGKRYALVSYDKIQFSDGTSFPFPIGVVAVEKDGRTCLKWVSLHNERELVVYAKFL